jgi:hypothetical protein
VQPLGYDRPCVCEYKSLNDRILHTETANLRLVPLTQRRRQRSAYAGRACRLPSSPFFSPFSYFRTRPRERAVSLLHAPPDVNNIETYRNNVLQMSWMCNHALSGPSSLSKATEMLV